MKQTFETLCGIKVDNNWEFWGPFWDDPAKLMTSALESAFSGLLIQHCATNDTAIRVHIAGFSLDRVNQLHDRLQAFATRLNKICDNTGFYRFKVDAVIEADNFVKFTLNY